MFKKRYIPDGTANPWKEIKDLRVRRGISLETISKKTKIPLKYLKALEEGSTGVLPDVLYVKNIIKKYLSFLNVDPRPFLGQLAPRKKIIKEPQKALDKKLMLVVPRIIKALIGFVLIGAFIIYIILEINKIFKPPMLLLYSPQEGEATSSTIIEVKGKTDPGTKIFINDESIILNNDNIFNKDINLQKGLNLIKISGINRYSKENVIWRNVILQIE
ncbi:helix-turn-helix domain-containing protein [Candidatus Parcubacteria bacterium]|nr:helix-turn-helix domain-containing protein [Patescibacteria group bacterium]MCG2693773.1 helix-turn-helix domain-containing protein [Candidatus Parcubacteria bacterium]